MRYLTVLASVAVAVLLLPNSASAQNELSFTREDISLGTFIGPRESAAGDFNGDGRVDLVIGTAGSVTSPIQMLILLGEGDGGFQSPQSVNTEQAPISSILVTDFNDDGLLDLSALGRVAAIRLGNGDGTFQTAPDVSLGANSGFSSATGDFNSDGAQDLAVSVESMDIGGGGSIRIYLGNGDGTFSRACYVIADGNPRRLTAGDFNGDGDQDLAAIDFLFEHNSVLILLGQGDGTFQPVPEQSAVSPETVSLTVGDFDEDGRQDVATADPNRDVLSVLLGNGDGTFQPAQNYPTGVQPGPGMLVQAMAIEVADIDGDGHQDLVTANRRPADSPIADSGVSILLGRGDGTFEPAQEFATAMGTRAIVVADFNNDGRPDLATSNTETSSVTILTAGSHNPQLAVIGSNPAARPAASGASGGTTSGGGSFGSELWLLAAIALGRYARRRGFQRYLPRLRRHEG